MHTPRLMLITDRALCPVARLPAVAVDAIRGGVDAVQVREKDLPDDALLDLARALREATAGWALLLVNGRIDVALRSGADGVQLGEEAETVARVRRCVGRDLLIGRSVHTVEGAVAAARAGADLLVLGTIYPSRSHPGGGAGGPALVRSVASRVGIPVVGIGGVTVQNAAEVIRAGAAGVAVISSILAAADAGEAANGLRQVIDSALAHPERAPGAWGEAGAGVQPRSAP